MSKNSYHIINKATKQSIYNDKYDVCLYIFTNKHKLFRQTHKIISDEEYQKIIKKTNIMIKLSFNKFNFTTDGITSRGSIIATIKYYLNGKYKTVVSKKFETKITLHKDDAPDLNKAYKYVRAKLERDAYDWAGKEAKKEFHRMYKRYNIFDKFIEKASHIVSHNNKYLKTF